MDFDAINFGSLPGAKDAALEFSQSLIDFVPNSVTNKVFPVIEHNKFVYCLVLPGYEQYIPEKLPPGAILAKIFFEDSNPPLFD